MILRADGRLRHATGGGAHARTSLELRAPPLTREVPCSGTRDTVWHLPGLWRASLDAAVSPTRDHDLQRTTRRWRQARCQLFVHQLLRYLRGMRGRLGRIKLLTPDDPGAERARSNSTLANLHE